MVRSGNRADERCRVERRAHGHPWRPSPRKEARPSQLTGDRVGLGTRRRRTQGALPLSYARPGLMWRVVPGGGIRTRNHPLKRRRNPRLRIRPTRLRSIVVRLRGQDSNPDFLVQNQAWCRCTTSHRSGWRDSNSQPPAPRAGALLLRHIQLAGTDGRIRTDTGGGLSAVPLPVGLRQHWWTERESNPHPPPCKGVTLPVAPPARGGGGGDRTRAQGV